MIELFICTVVAYISGMATAAIMAKPYIEQNKCNQPHWPIIFARDADGLTALDYNSHRSTPTKGTGV